MDNIMPRPAFKLMKEQYEKYSNDTQPCKFGYKNQCAIRMSLALANCGITFERFRDQKRIHQGRDTCRLGETPHIVGAEELFAFLISVWDTGLTRRPGKAIKPEIKGKVGVIYFNNCFLRKETDTSLKGDHIDLWDGSQFYNQILGISAGGGASAKTDLFSRADSVSFLWLP